MGSFSNNNYIPSIGQYPGSEMVGLPYTNSGLGGANSSLGPGGATNYPGTFTFAVPTQASQMTTVMSQSALPRSLYSSHMPFGLVPGLGASWQHSVPNQMPWTDVPSAGVATGVTEFTGMPNFVFTPTISSSAIVSPRPSCSATRVRNKRRATEDIEDSSPEHKVFLSEERMADKMKNLSLCNLSSSDQELSSLPDIVLSTAKRDICDGLHDEYSRLKEIESRLEVDIEDTSDDSSSDSESHQPKLHLHETIAKEILSQDSILPKKILQDIKKPCLQVVLWKPPGGFSRDPVVDPDHFNTSSDKNSAFSEHRNQTLHRNSSFSSFGSGDMETEDSLSSVDSDMLL